MQVNKCLSTKEKEMPINDKNYDSDGSDMMLESEEAEEEEWCPERCGCRLGTEDADIHECGCDGPCRGITHVITHYIPPENL